MKANINDLISFTSPTGLTEKGIVKDILVKDGKSVYITHHIMNENSILIVRESAILEVY